MYSIIVDLIPLPAAIAAAPRSPVPIHLSDIATLKLSIPFFKYRS